MWGFLFLPSLIHSLCTNQYGFITTTEPCLECYLLGLGEECQEILPQHSYQVASKSEQYPDLTQCSQDNRDVTSKFGALCIECNSIGYLVQDAYGLLHCVCYAPDLNPLLACSNNISEVKTLQIVEESWPCEPFTTPCFKLDKAPVKYGEPSPPLPSLCCDDWMGPPPAGIIVNGACSMRGETVNGRFLICSEHGDWNDQYCECHHGWQATAAHLTCDSCMDGWGPPGLCSVMVAPEPSTGVVSECSGHGAFLDGECVCYRNSTGGYWSLVDFTIPTKTLLGNGTTVNGTITFGTCADCMSGFFGTDCLECALPTSTGILLWPLTEVPLATTPCETMIECRRFNCTWFTTGQISFNETVGESDSMIVYY